MTSFPVSESKMEETLPDVGVTGLLDGLSRRAVTYKTATYPLANAPLTSTVTEDYQKLIVSFTRDLIIEYGCETPSEKALAQMAAVAYAKALDYGEELRNSRAIEFHSGALNGYFSMIGKEVDRANRQFMTAFMTLKQTKAPKVEINVTATNAFMAKEQQFNVSQGEKSNNENVEPK